MRLYWPLRSWFSEMVWMSGRPLSPLVKRLLQTWRSPNSTCSNFILFYFRNVVYIMYFEGKLWVCFTCEENKTINEKKLFNICTLTEKIQQARWDFFSSIIILLTNGCRVLMYINMLSSVSQNFFFVTSEVHVCTSRGTMWHHMEHCRPVVILFGLCCGWIFISGNVRNFSGASQGCVIRGILYSRLKIYSFGVKAIVPF